MIITVRRRMVTAMRKIITAIAGLAVAAGAYLAGSAVQATRDHASQHAVMGAIVTGQSLQIDGRTYVARPQR